MQDKDIKPAYKHSKVGSFMFYLCAKWTKLLTKCKLLYYFLSITWGIIMTLVGIVITVVLIIPWLFSDKISFKKYCWVYAISIGPDYWGGFDTGLMFVRDQKSWEGLDRHEFGHTFQNCLLGPLMLFVVSLPSAIRWWYRYLKYEKNNKYPPTDYDAIWFEDAASQCGKYAAQIIIDKSK